MFKYTTTHNFVQCQDVESTSVHRTCTQHENRGVLSGVPSGFFYMFSVLFFFFAFVSIKLSRTTLEARLKVRETRKTTTREGVGRKKESFHSGRGLARTRAESESESERREFLFRRETLIFAPFATSKPRYQNQKRCDWRRRKSGPVPQTVQDARVKWLFEAFGEGKISFFSFLLLNFFFLSDASLRF